MKRLFAAFKIQPDKEFLETYRNLKNAMRLQQVKWVEEHNIHVTIKFFGETEEKLVPAITKNLAERATRTQGMVFCLKGLGIFGSRYDPRVIWTGIEPYAELAKLMKDIRDDMIPVGFEPDRQNAVPHLTLGRVKEVRDRKSFDEALEKYRGIVSVALNMTEIILFESILRRQGPEYYPLKIIRMADSAR